MLGRFVIASINAVSCRGTGYGICVAEPKCGLLLLQLRHSSRDGLGLDVELVSVS
jgi:hypothetical protein